MKYSDNLYEKRSGNRSEENNDLYSIITETAMNLKALDTRTVTTEI